jgi:spore coat protein U-like protein
MKAIKSNNARWIPWLSALLFAVVMVLSGEAWGAPPVESGPIACTVSSPVYSATYSPFASANNVTALSFDVTCTRSTSLIATTVAYSVRSLNGSYPSGGGNNAQLSGLPPKLIAYDLYLDSTCTTLWKGPDRITNTRLFLPDGETKASAMHTFYVCVPAAQTSVVFGAPYTDSAVLEIVNVSGNPGTPNVRNQTNGLLNVSINVPKVCNMSTQPGPVAFGTYAAFGSEKKASSTFGVKCTNAATYEMALTDGNGRPLTTGVVAGLSYTLALSVATVTGNGAEIFHKINGTMPAKQAGSCANGGCSGTKSNTHYLTLTY